MVKKNTSNSSPEVFSQDQLVELNNEVKQDPVNAFYKVDKKIAEDTSLSKDDLKKLYIVKELAKQYLPSHFNDQVISQATGGDQTKIEKLNKLVNNNPKKMFKKAYNLATSGNLSLSDYKVAKAIADKAKEQLLLKNIDPNDIIKKKTPVGQAWAGFTNILSVPVNTVAAATQQGEKALTGKTTYTPVRIWGGTWGDFIQNNQLQNPKYREVLRKLANDETLSKSDQAFLKKNRTAKFWGGLAGDLLLDPLNFVGGITDKVKDLKKAVKIAEGGSKVNKLSDVAKIEGAKKLANFATATFESSDKIKDLAKGIKEANKQADFIKNANSILEGSKTILNTLEQTQPASLSFNKLAKDVKDIKGGFNSLSDTIPKARNILKSINKSEENLFKTYKIAENLSNDPRALKQAKSIINAYDTGKGAVGNSLKAVGSGLNKVVDAIPPLSFAKGEIKRVGKGLRKAFVSDAPKIIEKESRRAKSIRQLGDGIYNDYHEAIVKTGKDIEDIVKENVNKKLIGFNADKILEKNGTKQAMRDVFKKVEAGSLAPENLATELTKSLEPYISKDLISKTEIDNLASKIKTSLESSSLFTLTEKPKAKEKAARSLGFSRLYSETIGFVKNKIADANSLFKKGDKLNYSSSDIGALMSKYIEEGIDSFYKDLETGKFGFDLPKETADQLAEKINSLIELNKQLSVHRLINESLSSVRKIRFPMLTKEQSQAYQKALDILKKFDRLNADNRGAFTTGYKNLYDYLMETIDSSAIQKNLNWKSLIDQAEGNVKQYVFHSLSQDFKDFISKFKSEDDKEFDLLSKLPTRRGFKGTIEDINNMGHYMFPDFKGKLYESDLRDIIPARLSKTGSFVENETLLKGVLQKLHDTGLISSKPKEGMVDAYGLLKLKKVDLEKFGIKGIKDKAYVPAEIADYFKNAFNPKNRKKISRQILMVYDMVNNFIKGMLTVGSFFGGGFKFFNRNMVGNLFNEFASGVKAASIIKGNAFVYSNLLHREGVISKLKTITTKTGKIYSFDEIERMAKKFGVVGTGISQEVLRDINETVRKIDKEIKSPLGKKIGKASAKTVNAMNWVGSKLNGVIEDGSKEAFFVANLIEGKTPLEASDMVKKALFDYGDLTKAEKTVFKRIVPFYTWMRKNVAFQAETLLKRPFNSAYRITQKTIKDFNQRQSDIVINEHYKNNLLKGSQLLRISKDEQTKNEVVFMLSGLLPSYDLSLFYDLYKHPTQTLFDNMSPLVSEMIGAMTGVDIKKQDLYRTTTRGRHLTGQEVFGKFVNNILKLTPFKRIYSNIPFLSGNTKRLSITQTINYLPEKTKLQVILSLLIGTPLNYDENLSKIITSRNQIKDLNSNITDFISTLYKLNRAYTGTTFPKKDLKKLGRTWLDMYNSVKKSTDEGTFNTGKNKRVISSLKKALRIYLKTVDKYRAMAGLPADSNPFQSTKKPTKTTKKAKAAVK